MTAHADTLRDLADEKYLDYGGRIITDREHPALLAGAAALDTLTKVRKVAELLDQMAEDIRRAATRLDWAAPGAIGRAHGYAIAAELIREALGGTR